MISQIELANLKKQFDKVAKLRRLEVQVNAAILLLVERILNNEDIEDGDLECFALIQYTDLTPAWEQEFEDWVKTNTNESWTKIHGEVRRKTFERHKPVQTVVIRPKAKDVH